MDPPYNLFSNNLNDSDKLYVSSNVDKGKRKAEGVYPADCSFSY